MANHADLLRSHEAASSVLVATICSLLARGIASSIVRPWRLKCLGRRELQETYRCRGEQLDGERKAHDQLQTVCLSLS